MNSHELPHYEPPVLPPVMTVAEVARFLRIGKNQAYALVASEGLGIRINGRWRIPRHRLEAWLDGQRPGADGSDSNQPALRVVGS